MRNNSQNQLASIYGGAHSTSGSGGSRRAVSTSSSPVPWENSTHAAAADSEDTSPEILTIQSNPVSARETRETLEDAGVGTQDEGLQTDELQEQQHLLQRLRLDEGMQTDSGMLRAHSVTSKSAKQLAQLGKAWCIVQQQHRHVM